MKKDKMTRDRFLAIAQASRLEFSEEEMEAFEKSFSEMTDVLDKIAHLDFDEIEDRLYINKGDNHLRDSEVRGELSQEEALSNTGSAKYGYFKMMKFVD
ncbi:MAG: Asp-tRNA(Asn)/Glu-tRNA(Gln) amidotransferase subunit GatC [Tissierellia bacterium]|nr:Asp-tRNA(Asn)/Glu-tRNA(Gln) amidotransferase subunit GatC [Tissierellia bacterium]